MLRSLFAGISGLRVNQTALDVTGNNIANANTVGFKSSSTVFSDTLSQMLTAASAPAGNGNLGGTNAIQIGLGTQLASVKTNFTQGANETTGVPTDMMVSGDGFFVVGDGSNRYLTRAGAFSFDTNGNMVAPDGKLVQGYAVSGYADTEDLTTTPPTHVGDPIYANRANDGGTPPVIDSTDTAGTGLGTMNLKMNDDGTTSGPLGTYWAARGYDGSTPALAIPKLQSYTIGRDGTITGTYSNGERLAIGRIAIANVQNPQGLEKAGDSEYVYSPNSGLIEYGAPGENSDYGQNGLITTGALEMSNVDLSQEFTNLILAQRGFQASSKVITTSDEVLETLVNMKR
ncbi:MAG: flagellar hook protein FlgE [Nocardioides sp.]